MTEALRLASGDYTLEWVVEPAAGSTDECGVTIALFDVDGEYSYGQTGVLEVVVPPASGSVDYMLPVGDYDLFVYVGCPWEMRLDGEPWPED